MIPRTRSKRRRKFLLYLYLGLIGGACGWILLGDVLSKNRIIDIGRAQRDAERDIADLHRDILDLQGKVDEAMQPRNLKERLADYRTRLRDIHDESAPDKPVPMGARPTRP